jgi:hypothetical protein
VAGERDSLRPRPEAGGDASLVFEFGWGRICEKQIRLVVSDTYLQQAGPCLPRVLSHDSSRHGTGAQGAFPHTNRVSGLQGQITRAPTRRGQFMNCVDINIDFGMMRTRERVWRPGRNGSLCMSAGEMGIGRSGVGTRL